MVFIALTIYTAIQLPTVVDLLHLPPLYNLAMIYDHLSHVELPSLPASVYEALPLMPAIRHLPNLTELHQFIGSLLLPNLSAIAWELHGQDALLVERLQPYLPRSVGNGMCVSISHHECAY